MSIGSTQMSVLLYLSAACSGRLGQRIGSLCEHDDDGAGLQHATRQAFAASQRLELLAVVGCSSAAVLLGALVCYL